MPSTDAIALLMRRNQISQGEWLKLIELRCAMIKPHLDSFTLGTLGEMECLQSESHKHTIGHDHPEMKGGFPLDTQGIFRKQPYDKEKRAPRQSWGFMSTCPDSPIPANGSLKIWGLSRKGLLLVATVEFVGEAGYKGRGKETAKTVTVQEVDSVATLLAETGEEPETVWQELGKEIKNWVKRRRYAYEDARALRNMIEAEELIYSSINPPK